MVNKKVACLYRVSTMAQVDKLTDDIPMQKNACRDFIEKTPGWELGREYEEKGVSGYKKKAEDRDVLQQIRKDAEQGQFNVLLVFMFDRLGRREDETPFILEWFNSQGIEVWSVKEGQQRFDNRVDKLMNYIRFWQSGGESEKIGIRVKEQHHQMAERGQFTGGPPPYGYSLIPSGEVNKKGRPTKKLIINEAEAEIVRDIYRVATVEGLGGHRISILLNERGVPTRKGSKWGLTVVNYILRNPLYKGYPVYGKTSAASGTTRRKSPDEWIISKKRIDELAIIDEETWAKAAKIRTARTPARFNPETLERGTYPTQTKSALLLIGKIKCGHCGSTLCTYTSISKWTNKNKNTKRKVSPSYRCTSVNRGITCEGQITYSGKRIEAPVLDEVKNYLDSLERINYQARIDEIRNNNTRKEAAELRTVEGKIHETSAAVAKLNNEIAKALVGESDFTTVQLADAIAQKNAEIETLNGRRDELQALFLHRLQEVDKFNAVHTSSPEWRNEFELASTEAQKMMLAEILEEVTVYRDQIDVTFKVSFEEFANLEAYVVQ
jgi:DNA invertase Pin-like site-specific DNA recombinase